MIIDKNNVIMTNEEYSALINEFNALQHNYNDICDRYRLCKDANETIKQKCAELIKENGQFRLENNDLEAQIARVRKETAKEILLPLLGIIAINVDTLNELQNAILVFAKQYGVEVEE